MKHLLLVALLGFGTTYAEYSSQVVENSRRALMEGEFNEEELSLIMNKTAKPGFEPGQYQISDEV